MSQRTGSVSGLVITGENASQQFSQRKSWYGGRGTTQKPLLEETSHAISVRRLQRQQVKQVFGIPSSAFKHPVLDGGQDQEVWACVSL